MLAGINTAIMDRRDYHHGDLRHALLAEGLRLLGERNGQNLSLREVARGVGVSATSVYRHFPDKNALMTALAREGLAKLAEVHKEAIRAAGGGDDGFVATGRAYVRFALANPALFRLIFTSPESWTPGEEEAAAMTMLLANAAAQIGAAPGDEAARIKAIHAWSLVHGLAMLMLDRQIDPDDAIIDLVID